MPLLCEAQLTVLTDRWKDINTSDLDDDTSSLDLHIRLYFFEIYKQIATYKLK